MSEDELDVIIVGAGPAGLACAWEAASKGLEVAVLERGDVAGAKNLSGGRLYLEPLRELAGGLLEDAPYEREVVWESLVLAGADSSISLRVRCESEVSPGSVTVLRAKLDEFLADRAGDAGALVMGQQRVDELVRDGDRIAGVRVGPEELRAKYLVAADGVLSFLAEETGLRQRRSPETLGVGVKEIIQLDKGLVSERFNVDDKSGEARLYVGEITDGLPGGGFLYTNIDSISLGLVVHMSALQKDDTDSRLSEMLEAFKARSDVKPLISGGKTVEYGAHLIPEGGFDAIPSLGKNGMLLAGDAAGFVVNTGATVRGMDLAIASGVLAARSIAASIEERTDFGDCLSRYQEALKESFVMRQLEKHRKAPDLLTLERFYGHYPKETVRLARDLFAVDSSGESLSIGQAMKKFRRDVLGWHGLKDLWRLYRM